ncbi:MAG: hypothetical protein E7273_14840 [Pseudobutyrivibrio ruminis]|nr:hypothetical protein [Pseudobutyrivibrio ruminis]
MDDELYQNLIARKEYDIKTMEKIVVTGDINISTPVEKTLGTATYSSMDILNIIFVNSKCSVENLKKFFFKQLISQLESNKTLAIYRMSYDEFGLDTRKFMNELKTFETLNLVAIKGGFIELSSKSAEIVAKYRLNMNL